MFSMETKHLKVHDNSANVLRVAVLKSHRRVALSSGHP